MIRCSLLFLMLVFSKNAIRPYIKIFSFSWLSYVLVIIFLSLYKKNFSWGTIRYFKFIDALLIFSIWVSSDALMLLRLGPLSAFPRIVLVKSCDLITLKVGLALVSFLIISWTRPLKSGDEERNGNGLIYYFDKSNLNWIYPHLRWESRMKILFFLSNSFEYYSIKFLFIWFKNLGKDFFISVASIF